MELSGQTFCPSERRRSATVASSRCTARSRWAPMSAGASTPSSISKASAIWLRAFSSVSSIVEAFRAESEGFPETAVWHEPGTKFGLGRLILADIRLHGGALRVSQTRTRAIQSSEAWSYLWIMERASESPEAPRDAEPQAASVHAEKLEAGPCPALARTFLCSQTSVETRRRLGDGLDSRAVNLRAGPCSQSSFSSSPTSS